MDLKSAAYILFMQGLQQKEIALLLKVSDRTISNYAIEGNWKAKREEENTFKETAAEKVRYLINHNLTILQMIAEKQTVGLDSSLEITELQKRLISKGDADGLAKLYAQIKGTEAEWDILVKNVKQFFEYLETQELKIAQKAWPHAHDYLNQRRKES